MSKKAKIISVAALFLVLAITLVAVFLFGPMPMRVDWNAIHRVETNVTLLAPGEGINATDAPALVKLMEDGETIDMTPWKVLQFTDQHYGDRMDENETTLKNFLKAIYEEKPDYVVLTGDIVTSIRGRSRAVQLGNIFEKLGIYWTYAIGNHEGDQFLALSRSELISILAEFPHCVLDDSVKYTEAGERVWGVGNCVVNLLGEGNKVVQSMIFMDTGDAITDADAEALGVRKGSYDYLKDNQKQWYKEQVMKVTENLTNGVKTMLFIHIPLVEQGNVRYVSKSDVEKDEKGEVKVILLSEHPEGYLDTLDDATKQKIEEGKITVFSADFKKVPGSELIYKGETLGWLMLQEDWKLIDGTASYEGCCSSDYNNGMYALMKEMRAGVNGLFCGHDHINNSVLYEEDASPIYLCYGTCGGYATYSLYTKNKSEDPDALKGYDIINIYADSTFDYIGVNYADITVKMPLILAGQPVE